MIEGLKGISVISNEEFLEYSKLKEENEVLKTKLKNAQDESQYNYNRFLEKDGVVGKARAIIAENTNLEMDYDWEAEEQSTEPTVAVRTLKIQHKDILSLINSNVLIREDYIHKIEIVEDTHEKYKASEENP